MELQQSQINMAMTRGRTSLNRNDPDYQGKGGAKLWQEDRENYKDQTGMYPDKDPQLLQSVKASKRYGGKPQ